MLLSSDMCQKYTKNNIMQRLLSLRAVKPLLSIYRLECPESSARPCGPHDLLLSAGNLARQWAKHVRPSVLTHQPLMPAAGDYQSRKFGGDSAGASAPRAACHPTPPAPSTLGLFVKGSRGLSSSLRHRTRGPQSRNRGGWFLWPKILRFLVISFIYLRVKRHGVCS